MSLGKDLGFVAVFFVLVGGHFPCLTVLEGSAKLQFRIYFAPLCESIVNTSACSNAYQTLNIGSICIDSGV